MICQPCLMGGLINSTVRAASDPALVSRLEYTACEWHKDCYGCDCQHRTGDWRNRRGDS